MRYTRYFTREALKALETLFVKINKLAETNDIDKMTDVMLSIRSHDQATFGGQYERIKPMFHHLYNQRENAGVRITIGGHRIPTDHDPQTWLVERAQTILLNRVGSLGVKHDHTKALNAVSQLHALFEDINTSQPGELTVLEGMLASRLQAIFKPVGVTSIFMQYYKKQPLPNAQHVNTNKPLAETFETYAKAAVVARRVALNPTSARSSMSAKK